MGFAKHVRLTKGGPHRSLRSGNNYCQLTQIDKSRYYTIHVHVQFVQPFSENDRWIRNFFAVMQNPHFVTLHKILLRANQTERQHHVNTLLVFPVYVWSVPRHLRLQKVFSALIASVICFLYIHSSRCLIKNAGYIMQTLPKTAYCWFARGKINNFMFFPMFLYTSRVVFFRILNIGLARTQYWRTDGVQMRGGCRKTAAVASHGITKWRCCTPTVSPRKLYSFHF